MGLGFHPRKTRDHAGDNATTKASSASHSPAVQGFRSGGPVRGPGTPTSDSIAARVPVGSFVMPADSTQALGEDQLAKLGAVGFKPRKAPGIDVRLSDGEFLLDPADVHAVGVRALEGMKDATHTPARGFSGAGVAPSAAVPRGMSLPAVPPEPPIFFREGGAVGAGAAMGWGPPRGHANAAGQHAPNPGGDLPSSDEVSRYANGGVVEQAAQVAQQAARGFRAYMTGSNRPGAEQLNDPGAVSVPSAPKPAWEPMAPSGDRSRVTSANPAGIRFADGGEVSSKAAGFGFRPRRLANGGLVTVDDPLQLDRTAQPAASGEAIGRRPTIHMGAAQEVPRTALPPPSNSVAPAGFRLGSVATSAPEASTASGEVIGRRPTVSMGMADVVPQERLAAPAAAPAIASARGFVARAAGPAGAALGATLEGKQVLDVARDPNATGIDVAAQAARGVGRLASAGAGAAGGAALGAMTGPLAPVAVPLGAVAGGAYGYMAADKAIEGGGTLTRAAMHVPAPAPALAVTPDAGAGGSDYPATGGAAFGFFPNAPRGGTDARVVPAQAQVRAIDSQPTNAAAIAAAPTQVPPPAEPAAMELPPFGGGPVTDPNDKIGVVGAAGVTSADRIAQMRRDTQHLQDMEQLQGQRDQYQGLTSGAPGAVIMDDTAARTDARQKFFDEANLRNVLARGPAPGRAGAAAFAQQVEAASLPIQQRAEAANVQAREQGASKRTALQVAFETARDRRAALQQAEKNDIDRARLGVEALRAGQTGVPAGYRLNADGTLSFIKGGPADPETAKGKNALNDTQSKALQFGTRMQQSNKILDDLASKGVNVATPGSNIGHGIGAAINALQPQQRQQLDQAQRDFVNAVLRRESGAAISESEFENARKQYFPQVGEGPDVIAQKRANRALATQGILAEVPDQERRVQQVLAAAGAGNAAPSAAPAALVELRRRAANNPQLAERLRAAGY